MPSVISLDNEIHRWPTLTPLLIYSTIARDDVRLDHEGGRSQQVLRSTRVLHPALVKDEYPTTQLKNLIDVMRGHDAQRAHGRHCFSDQGSHLRSGPFVKGSGGLVEEQDPRSPSKRASERHLVSLTSGEFVGSSVPELRHAEAL